jgi:hypothetical protein
MSKESQYKLLEALKAHMSNLEDERHRASGHKEALDRRLEAGRQVLEWLSTRLTDDQYQSAPPLRRSGSYSLPHL